MPRNGLPQVRGAAACQQRCHGSEWDLARSQQILQIGISKITDGTVFSEIFEGQYSSPSRVNAVRSSSAAVGLGHHFILFQFLIILGFSTLSYYCSD